MNELFEAEDINRRVYDCLISIVSSPSLGWELDVFPMALLAWMFFYVLDACQVQAALDGIGWHMVGYGYARLAGLPSVAACDYLERHLCLADEIMLRIAPRSLDPAHTLIAIACFSSPSSQPIRSRNTGLAAQQCGWFTS